MTTPGVDTVPPPASSGEAFAALDHAHQQLKAAEVAEVIAIAHAADLYEVDQASIGAGIERLLGYGNDGTPWKGEFLALEVAALLGISVQSAIGRVGAVLDLRHRHPALWAAVLGGGVRFWQANQILNQCAHLSAEAVARVDGLIAQALPLLPWRRVVASLSGWIITADPVLAAERARCAADHLKVGISPIQDGQVNLWGKVTPADGVAFDHALTEIAKTLPTSQRPSEPAGMDFDRRRAAALGVLAKQAFGQETLPTHTLVVHINANDPAIRNNNSMRASGVGVPANGNSASAADLLGTGKGQPDGGTGGTNPIRLASGTSETNPDPSAISVPQIGVTAGGLPACGVAYVEKWGALLTELLPEFLAGSRVVVRPVINPNTMSAVDGYQTPTGMRFALNHRNPYDVFPYGTKPAANCEADHTIAYQPGEPGQTHLGNLGPLSKFTHRAKTHGGWQLAQPEPGVYQWTSPAGYRYQVTAQGTTRIQTPNPI